VPEMLIHGPYYHNKLTEELRSGIIKSNAPIPYLWGDPVYKLDMASSFLLPSEEQKKKLEAKYKKKDDNPDLDIELCELSCRYAPINISDGDTDSSWCTPFGPKGESILAASNLNPDLKPVENLPTKIFNGFGGSKPLYFANNRAKKIRVYILEPKKIIAEIEADGQGAYAVDSKVIAKHEVELKDVYGWQALPLPKYDNKKQRPLIVAIEILSAYKGKKYEDTCIAGVN